MAHYLHNLLVIKANPKETKDSFSLQMTDEFVKNYREHHPNAVVREIDLYQQNIGHLDAKMIENMRQGKLNEATALAKIFAEHNRFVFAAPIWNMGIPSILKAFFDYVCQPGITFRYTANGPEGLIKRSKALFLTARGGNYRGEHTIDDLEMSELFMQNICGLMGIRQFQTVAMEGTAAEYPSALIPKFNKVLVKIAEIAETF